MKCLDTTFLIDFLRGNSDAARKISKTEKDEFITTAINVFEIVLGIYLMKDKSEEKLMKFYELISNLEVLPFDFESSIISSRIIFNLIKDGEQIDDLDGLIAGILEAKGVATIITNDKHFSRIEGIKVENY